MTDLDYLFAYDEDPDFKEYVDKVAKTYRKSIAFVCKMPITREYYKTLQKGGCNAKRSYREETD